MKASSHRRAAAQRAWAAARLAATGLILVAIVPAPAACADDAVYAASTSGSGQVKRAGEIIDYTGRGVRIRSAAGRSTIIPLDKVIRIETELCASQRAGDAAMADGDFEKAVSHYETAIRGGEETRPWMRRRILASVITCQQALGQHDVATRYFVGLLRDDDQTPYFDAIPLAWLPSQGLGNRDAERWIADDLAAVRLLAASYLLSTGLRQTAITTLKDLADDADDRIATLAMAQLWRTTLTTATAADLPRWSAGLDKIPASLRAGPYYVLGTAQARLDQHEAAALTFMHVPILFPNQRELAAESLLASGKALVEMNRRPDAARVFQELVAEYASSTAATEAQQRLDALTKAP